MITTLCYLEKDSKYLMLHRTKKEIDINKGKWLGVGGKIENGETPEQCLKREVMEETGYELKSYDFKGIVVSVSIRMDSVNYEVQKTTESGIYAFWAADWEITSNHRMDLAVASLIKDD